MDTTTLTEKTTNRFCTRCGTALAPDGQFCAGCGAPLRGAGPDPAGGRPSRRWVIAVVTLAGAVVLSGVAFAATRADRSPVPPAAPSPVVASTTTTTAAVPVAAADARTAWTTVLGLHPGATSSPVGPLTTSAVVAEGRTAFVYRFLNSAWQQRAVLDLGIEAVTSQPIRVADVTGDHEDDFVISLAGADNIPGSVVSAAGGAWRLVPFVDQYQSANGMDSAPDLRVEGSQLISTVNTCVPNCAAGTTYEQPWSYDELNGVFYPNTGPGTPGGSGE